MPPKPVAKAGKVGKAGKADKVAAAGAVTLAAYCDVIRGSTITTSDSRVIRKPEALIRLWNYALLGDNEREELYKLGVVPALQTLLDKGEPEERCAAMGALVVMARLDKHTLEVFTPKVISGASAMLQGEHERSKLQACTMLSLAAARIETNAKVAEHSLPGLVGILREEGPGWAQVRRAQCYAAATLKLLIDNAEGDVVEVKMARRMAVIELGAVPALMSLVAYSPKMPPPARVPQPLPAPSSKVTKPKKGKAGAKPTEYPLGSKDDTATAAAACLRFLSMCPGFMNGVTASGHLPAFVASLVCAHAEQAAFISGVLWEVCAEAEVAEVVASCNAVPALLQVISANIGSLGKGKSKKKRAEEAAAAAEKGRNGREREVIQPPNYHNIAVCNAAGALHHLTFLDACKYQLGDSGGVPILQVCLKVNDPQTYENAAGCLWNVGLDHRNTDFLLAAGTPAFLARPVPVRLMNDPDSPDDHQDQHSGGPSSTFMTQAPMA